MCLEIFGAIVSAGHGLVRAKSVNTAVNAPFAKFFQVGLKDTQAKGLFICKVDRLDGFLAQTQRVLRLVVMGF